MANNNSSTIKTKISLFSSNIDYIRSMIHRAIAHEHHMYLYDNVRVVVDFNVHTKVGFEVHESVHHKLNKRK